MEWRVNLGVAGTIRKGQTVGLPNDLLIVLLLVGAFIAIRFVEHQLGHRVGEGSYAARIYELERRIEAQRQDYEKKLADQKRDYEAQLLEQKQRIDFLIEQLQLSGVRIKELEKARDGNNDKGKEAERDQESFKSLLLICGSSAEMCDLDRIALRRAKVSFQRLYHASRSMITDALRRRRQDGTPYRWVHVAAHADDAGVELADGMADPAWWNETMIGIELVFLAACRTAKVADELAGMVTVISVTEEIENEIAQEFAYSFWKHMARLDSARDAYELALAEVPEVQEYTEIRET